MKSIFIKDGYLFNTESKKLEKFEVIKVHTTLAEDSCATYECKLGGVNAKITATPQDNIAVYASEEDYQKGNVMQMNNICATDATKVYTRNGEYWVFENGTAKEIDINALAVTFEKGVGFYNTERKKFYASREDVYKHNDYIVKEADGSERVVECLANKVAPNKEQRELLNELASLIDKMKDNNMVLVYSTEDCQFFAYNKEKAEEFNIAYNDEKGWEDYEKVAEFGVPVGCTINYIYSEDEVFMKFKEE